MSNSYSHGKISLAVNNGPKTLRQEELGELELSDQVFVITSQIKSKTLLTNEVTMLIIKISNLLKTKNTEDRHSTKSTRLTHIPRRPLLKKILNLRQRGIEQR